LFFLGVDGGSTKTEFILADEKGKVYSHRNFSGCSYLQLGGREPFESFFRDCIETVFKDGGIKEEDLQYTVIGLPAYGEIAETEEAIPDAFGNILPRKRFRIVNDAVVGWSGSLGARPGINIVAGTGSITYGVDPHGSECRVGGWSLYFDDEGSCTWVGLRAMSAFFMQSDGRLPRTALYEIFREHFHLTRDIYFSEMANKNLDAEKGRFAKMQLLAEKAYRAGDATMAALYRDAAERLAAMVKATRDQLCFDAGSPVPVSYSGGLFKAGDVVLVPFRRAINALGMDMLNPQYPPFIGAVALAASQSLDRDTHHAMLERLKDSEC
jgi:N-acetylglucosamine kinase-like BadF-type ATPase